MAGHTHSKESKTLWVVLLAAITMVVEVIYGISTNSMALLTDGIHMGSHVLAIGLSWLAYVFVRRVSKTGKFSGDTDKVLSLSGYSSGLLLLLFSIAIMIEAIMRLINPVEIIFKEAIIVACIGLVVNIVSAFLLHHDHEDSDHNIRAAYIHVIADALTSLAAILGLVAAMIWGITYIDTIAAIISSFIIIKWSIDLVRDSGSALLDMENTGAKHDHGCSHKYHHH